MIEIRVLPDGKLWAWKLRQKGREWIACKATSRKKKADVQGSAVRAADMLRAEGADVDLHLGYVNHCWAQIVGDSEPQQ